MCSTPPAAGASSHRLAAASQSRVGGRRGHNVHVIFLSFGEWPIALIGLALTFLVALTGATVLGWWVMRADSRNRVDEVTSTTESHSLHEEHSH